MASKARNANANLDLTGKTAAIAGGSQGIGAGIAVRLAKAGANVIILGRNEELLNKTVQEMKQAAPSDKQKLDSIKVDFSTVTATKQAAKDIAAKANNHLDYLFQTQGGLPNGSYQTTSEGIESHFAIQVLSRFVLQYQLASSGVLKSSSINILAPGDKSPAVDLEDIECASAKGGSTLAMISAMIRRDGAVTDAFVRALQFRFPRCSFYHLYPGVIQTNLAANQQMPWYFQAAFSVLGPIAARTFGNTPAGYADIPVFLAANEGQEKKELVASEGLFLNDSMKRVPLGPWSSDEENQTRAFERLRSYFDA